jgi:hypothetical protein
MQSSSGDMNTKAESKEAITTESKEAAIGVTHGDIMEDTCLDTIEVTNERFDDLSLSVAEWLFPHQQEEDAPAIWLKQYLETCEAGNAQGDAQAQPSISHPAARNAQAAACQQHAGDQHVPLKPILRREARKQRRSPQQHAGDRRAPLKPILLHEARKQQQLPNSTLEETGLVETSRRSCRLHGARK